MNTANENLRNLVGRLRQGDNRAWDQFQAELQPGMALVLRRALRTGTAGPTLKRWLGQAFRFVPDAADVDALASLLSNGMARQLRSVPNSAETVVERGAYCAAHI